MNLVRIGTERQLKVANLILLSYVLVFTWLVYARAIFSLGKIYRKKDILRSSVSVPYDMYADITSILLKQQTGVVMYACMVNIYQLTGSIILKNETLRVISSF